MTIRVGDFVRFGGPPYNIFRVNQIYETNIGTETVHGVYTELAIKECEPVSADFTEKAMCEARQRYLSSALGRELERWKKP
jgi:hypothetical protein